MNKDSVTIRYVSRVFAVKSAIGAEHPISDDGETGRRRTNILCWPVFLVILSLEVGK